MEERDYERLLLWLLTLSLLTRFILAAWLELGNDEVYYYQYALYPSLSYFDHPPMVGWLMRLFTLNLWLKGEWALRLTALISGTLNTWLIYRLGKEILNARTGFYAALLYTASFYTFIISGTFILPDAPQSTFWLLAMLMLMRSLGTGTINSITRSRLWWAGLFIGLGMLSKYTAVFLWAGAIGYVLFYNRKWLKVPELYLSALLTLIVFSPVLIWNIQNQWVSFGFHSERVDVTQGGLHLDYLLRELGGQIFYNNPIVVLLGWTAVFMALRGPQWLPLEKSRLLLFCSLPLILIFPGVSLWRETLPHWSGPGYHGLILLGASWLAERKSGLKRPAVPLGIKLALGITLLVIGAGLGQIKGGWIIKPQTDRGYFRGKKDFSLDMYGWRQLKQKAIPLLDSLENQGVMQKGSPLISFRWFPAANLDYYIAQPSGRTLLACGPLHRIHQYRWINQWRGGLQPGQDAWYLVAGRDFRKPEEVCPGCWNSIVAIDTLPILRGKDTVMFFFLYGMKDFRPCDAYKRFNGR
ncbi:MAG: glycosyltransferase family 39 protein [Bacteroidales bacterium]